MGTCIIWELSSKNKNAASIIKTPLCYYQGDCWCKQMKYSRSTVNFLVTSSKFDPFMGKYTRKKSW